MGRALPKIHLSLTKHIVLALFSMTAISALSPSLSIAGDASSPVLPAGSSPQLAVLTPADAAQAGNQLGYDVFGQLLRTSPPDHNLLISPYSLSAALSIVASGADGATASELRRTLHQAGLTDDDIAVAQRSLRQSLGQPDPAFTLSIANSLWGNRSVTFTPPFIDGAKETYAADVAAVDFAAPRTPQRINAWVSEHTNGMIPSMLDQLDPATTLVVTNAVSFKGLWEEPFAVRDTVTRPFHLGAGKEQATPIMFNDGLFLYDETPDSQAIVLPYHGGRLALTILLPKKDADQAFATAEPLDRRLDLERFAFHDGRIGLPRLHLAYDSDLTPTLRALGLNVALSDRADFGRMTSAPVQLGGVIQRTAMIVDEKGTEASAATSVTVVGAAAPSAHPFEMVVDRPFFVALRDSQTGAILFLGRIATPGTAQ